nr:MAG TPA: urease accessory protein [Caudoviricetes sp.]
MLLCSAVYAIGNQHFSLHRLFLYIFSLLIKVY